MKVCFLVPRLERSGGIDVITGHARRLTREEGLEPELVVTEEPGEARDDTGGVPVRTLDDARGESYDVAVGTWWGTAPALFELTARTRAIFLQSLEERFYRDWELLQRIGAAAVLNVPADFLAISPWMRDLLAKLRPDARCLVVPNGVDKEIFAARERQPREGPLRVLVEGQPSIWFKGVHQAMSAVRAMREPAEATLVALDPSEAEDLEADCVVGGLEPDAMADLYAANDVIVKLSLVEGFGLAPLEAFHLGVPCVVTPYTGHEDYVVHGENGLVVGFDDLPGTARALDLLARDRNLLARLSRGARATADGWPDANRSAGMLAVALRQIAEGPPPPAEPAVARMLRALENSIPPGRHRLGIVEEMRALIEELHASLAECGEHLHDSRGRVEDCRRQLEDCQRRFDEVTATRAYRAAVAARRVLDMVRR